MVLVLGIDIGTTSIGLCLVESGVPQYHASVQHNAYMAQIGDSTAEQDVAVLVDHTLELLSQLPQNTRHIDGIGVTGQMHGFVAWDEALNPVTTLITWEDRRQSVEQVQQVDASLQPGYGCASLMWLRQYKNEQLKSAVSCGTIMDYFVALLTSNATIAMTPQNAQSFGCFNSRQQWTIDDPLLPVIDTDYTLHTCRPHAKLAAKGESTRSLLNGALILSGLGDHQCTIMTQQASHSSDAIYFSFGTSSQCTMITDDTVTVNAPFVERRFFHPKLGFLLCAASTNGGNVIDHFAKLFNISYAKLGENSPTEPVIVKNCQLYAERGCDLATGVDFSAWHRHQTSVDLIYGLGGGLVANLLHLFESGTDGGGGLLNGVKNIHVSGGARQFTTWALKRRFPNAEMNNTESCSSSAAFGAALFYCYVLEEAERQPVQL